MPYRPRLRTTLILSIALILGFDFTVARGAGLNLGWSSSTSINDCPSSAASSANHNSLCDSNAGGTNLIGSIVAPAGLVKVTNEVVVVYYAENAATLSDWWLFDPGSCRGAAALNPGMNFSPPADDGICGNLWGQNATSGFSYQSNTYNGFQIPGRAKVSMVGVVPTILGQPWPEGTEWYSFILTILNTKTTGAGACSGCSDGVCFSFNEAQIGNDPSSVGGWDSWLFDATPGGRAYCTWNIANNPPCTSIPVKRTTWGEVKSLYR